MQVSLAVVWYAEVTTGPAQGLWHCRSHCWHLPLTQAACVTSAAPNTVFFPIFSQVFSQISAITGDSCSWKGPARTLWSNGPHWDGFEILKDPSPGQASVTQQHRLAFWGKSLGLLMCLWLLCSPGCCCQFQGQPCRKVRPAQDQLSCRSEKPIQGLSHSSSSKNQTKLLPCHSEGHALLSDSGVMKLWYSSSRQRWPWKTTQIA